MFLTIKKGSTVKGVFPIQQLLQSCINEPCVLLPVVMPSLFCTQPVLMDYVQLPLYLWIPDFFLPHLVPTMPCPEDDCAGGQSCCWRSGGPQLIHDMQHAMNVHC